MINRRRFLETTAGAAAGPILLKAQAQRPNILWLVIEDTGPHFHCSGDEYSITPNIDRLARRGCVFNNMWSNAPVCAPARTTIISGVYPTATGSEHMRSIARMPANWKMFPGYLREEGYYCTNNAKEDYNLEKPPGTWDESSRNGHWRNRKAGQPFFAVFNNETTHESQIWKSKTNQKFLHDPARVRVPAYHPDTPEVRKDWAQYYDNITTADTQIQARLDELEADGLLDDTIVFFYGDHGAGMPRNKRFPYDSGLRTSFVAAFPEKYRHLAPPDYSAGAISPRLLGFIDLAPTMLSLVGRKAPDYYQGQAFAGFYEAPPRTYSFGFRGRMDESYDLIRSVRDRRYVYLRNYNPHKVYGQYVTYAYQNATLETWNRLYTEGKLKPPQTYFWETKPSEELYDLETDRDEVNNLAGSSQHRATLQRFREAHAAHERSVRDVGLLPEAEIHARSTNSTPYEMGHDTRKYPFDRVLAAADLAISRTGDTERLKTFMEDSDSGVRYWGVMGVLMRGAEQVQERKEELDKALEDSSPSVRVAAAEAIATHGSADDVKRVVPVLVKLADCRQYGSYVAIQALNALVALDKKASPWKEQIAALPIVDEKSPARVNKEYTTKLLDHLKQIL